VYYNEANHTETEKVDPELDGDQGYIMFC